MAARREIRYLRLHQRVSCLCDRDRLQILRLLLCCRVLLAVPEYEADDELEAGGILREKPRPQPRERLFAFHGLSERTTVQTSSLLLRFFFFLPLGQLDPTRPISLTLTTQTPTPADRVVPIHSWRPLGHSTVWIDFVCVSGSVLYLVRTQSKK